MSIQDRKIDVGKYVDQLKTLLEALGKHTHYQSLPPTLLIDDPELSRLVGTRRQDHLRYEWLKAALADFSGTVTDIGANLGYFSFRILNDFDAKVTAYEPFVQQAKAISLMGRMLGEDGPRIEVIPKGVSLRGIDELPRSDLLIFLNVLQHAGEDFDSDLVRNSREWQDYAVVYLTKLRKKSTLMFFQLGYRWLGHAEKLCEDSDIIDFTADLLRRSGWSVKKAGVIKQYEYPLSYSDYSVRHDKRNKVFLRERRALRAVKKKIVGLNADLEMPYRFAQRPLWICE